MNGSSLERAVPRSSRAHQLLRCGLAAALLVGGSQVLRAQVPASARHYQAEPLQRLEQLAAPIALYPDPLLAEVLAASTLPGQVVEAEHWLRAHQGMSQQARADALNREPWDTSVKALIAFPSVLGNMDENIKWTTALGEVYAHQSEGLMTAMQSLRARARSAGHLVSTPEQSVTNNGPDLVIQPVSPNFVYIPEFDPWLAYGDPIEAWPSWYPYPGIWAGSAYVSFATGFSIGFTNHYRWGWNHWNCNWQAHYVSYDEDRYVTHRTAPLDHRSVDGGVRVKTKAPAPVEPRLSEHSHGEHLDAAPQVQDPGLRGDSAPRGSASQQRDPGLPLAHGAQASSGYPIGPRYRVDRGYGEGRGYPLEPSNHHPKGFPLGPRYRVERKGSGYPLHRAAGFSLAGRSGSTPPGQRTSRVSSAR